ncbi:MAG: ABC transporter permease [Myxococcota bacterium]|nr:ABC transporter permease [Myxococcota bacterium]
MNKIRFDQHQFRVLSQRYGHLLLSDYRAVFLNLLQVALIGLSVAGVWRNISGDSLTLYFVLCLSCFFFGAINSCREIVKERTLFLRERMFSLSVASYLASKYLVQSVVILFQTLLLFALVSLFIPLDVPIVVLMLAGVLVSWTGMALGFFVSAMVRTTDRAVVCVPLLIIPQILFSEFALGEGKLSNWTESAQFTMPVYWGYESMKMWWQEGDSIVSTSFHILPLALMIAGLFVVTLWQLKQAKD